MRVHYKVSIPLYKIKRVVDEITRWLQKNDVPTTVNKKRHVYSPISNHYSFSPVRQPPPHGFESAAAMAAAVMNVRSSAFARRILSFKPTPGEKLIQSHCEVHGLLLSGQKLYNQVRSREFSSVNDDNNSDVIYYMSRRSIEQQKQTMQQQHQLSPSGFGATPSLACVMQFADFGPKVALNQTSNQDDQETWMDPVYFLKLPVLNDKIEDHNQTHNLMSQAGGECEGNIVNVFLEEKENQDDENGNNSVQLHFTGGEEEGNRENENDLTKELKSKRKRTRTCKTSEEVESQRTTYIAVVKGTV
ncbi:hypothetical protein Bca52824_057001 [Brassica carinata]|uniref:Uncharacterized protein n=1 Tax=Brassica carinata TaxID=52824 RepID=A0A8X7UFU5_BRACI|nr:hypothetical protein Bca52824_057001 [Brassica carinata]